MALLRLRSKLSYFYHSHLSPSKGTISGSSERPTWRFTLKSSTMYWKFPTSCRILCAVGIPWKCGDFRYFRCQFWEITICSNCFWNCDFRYFRCLIWKSSHLFELLWRLVNPACPRHHGSIQDIQAAKPAKPAELQTHPWIWGGFWAGWTDGLSRTCSSCSFGRFGNRVESPSGRLT